MISALPPEFDPTYYRDIHPDLADRDERLLRDHYEAHGRREGRAASAACRRSAFLALVPADAPVLEIGPFDTPCVSGPQVSYFDVLDTAALRQRASEIGRKPEGVPFVRYVDANGSLGGIDARFSAIVSSHCIEHQPDLIRHLHEVETRLEDAGRYFVIVPDKRFCFDHYLPETTVAGVIDAHVAGRRVHTLKSVIEHRALTTHNDPGRHWSGDHANPDHSLTIASRADSARKEFEAAGGGYIDVHAWQFTPQSFRFLLTVLRQLSLTGFVVERVYDTPRGSNEFTAVLRKS